MKMELRRKKKFESGGTHTGGVLHSTCTTPSTCVHEGTGKSQDAVHLVHYMYTRK